MGDSRLHTHFFPDVRSSKLFIYVVVNLAVFTDAYIYGLIIPVLPFALVERIHLSECEVQEWIGILLAAYGFGLVVGSPIAGWFADRTKSRRGPYLWGLVALAISTLAFSIGRKTWILFVGRLIQGGSSAIVHTVGMAILADAVGQAGIGPAMGFVTMSIALGVVAGPIVGGLLYHQLGYLAVFVSAYALVGMDFLLRVVMLADEDGVGREHADVRSNVCNNETSSNEPSKPRRPLSSESSDSRSLLLSDSSSTSSTRLLLNQGSRNLTGKNAPAHRHPVLLLLTTPRMLAAILGDFMQSVVLTGLESTLPLRIKLLFSYNSQLVALVFLPLSLAPLLGPFFGHLSDRFGAKIMVCSGFLLTAPLLVLLRLVDHHDEGQVALLCVLLLLVGVALNMILTPVFSEATYVVDEIVAKDPTVFGERGAYARAFGLMNVAYAAGSMVGPLLCGLLVEKVGWNNLTLVSALICASCVIPCLYATGGRMIRIGSTEERGGHEA